MNLYWGEVKNANFFILFIYFLLRQQEVLVVALLIEPVKSGIWPGPVRSVLYILILYM